MLIVLKIQNTTLYVKAWIELYVCDNSLLNIKGSIGRLKQRKNE